MVMCFTLSMSACLVHIQLFPFDCFPLTSTKMRDTDIDYQTGIYISKSIFFPFLHEWQRTTDRFYLSSCLTSLSFYARFHPLLLCSCTSFPSMCMSLFCFFGSLSKTFEDEKARARTHLRGSYLTDREKETAGQNLIDIHS